MGGLPAWAVPNARVVCVRDFGLASHHNDLGYRTMPVENSVYIIGRTRAHIDGRPTVTLREFEHNHWFDLTGFRPAVEPKSEAHDLAYFRRYLTQTSPEEVA